MPKHEPKLLVPEFVKQIITDPSKHVETLLLSGYVGPSSEEDHTRLYFDPQLSQYAEIPNKAILYSQPLPPEASPLGAVFLWIEQDAQLVQGKAGTERAKAKFFEGPIAQAAFGGGGQWSNAQAGFPAQPAFFPSGPLASAVCVPMFTRVGCTFGTAHATPCCPM
jgi:hypothetical protein